MTTDTTSRLQPPGSAARSSQITVLVVEDNAELAGVYEGYLADSFAVQTVADGHQALDYLDNGAVDVVLLDRRMPGIDGDTVVAEMRDRGFDTPVAMITGVEPDVDIVDLSIDEYLTKPVDREALQRTVRVLANRSRFETSSREFFQLAAKQASLAKDGDIGDSREYASLLDRMRNLQETLDDTVRDLYAEARIASDTRPDPAEIDSLLVEIDQHDLPPEIDELLRSYATLEHARPMFMWKWVHRLAPRNELPFVDPAFTDKLAIDKTLVILFITILDDIYEKDHDHSTFAELAKIPFDEQRVDATAPGVETESVEVATNIWGALEHRLRSAPAFEDFDPLFRFDLKQALTAVEYSGLAIDRPDLATMADLERYEVHNMVMFAYADIDLMHATSGLDIPLPTLRKVVWHAQNMARIGNWVSTWERELLEGDFSAGPIVYALEERIITSEELLAAAGDPAHAESLAARIRDHGVEAEFLSRWERHYYELRTLDEQSTVDFGPFIDGTEEILRYHLASRGLK